MRSPVRPNKDKRVFRATASKGKKINISPKTYRGGICL